MSSQGSLFTFYTITSLHPGAGESSGGLDLPVQRESHTHYPVVNGQGIKGALRWHFQNNDSLKDKVESIFGKSGEKGFGKVVFTDAKILLFPARSSHGVFKWITCPFVIERLQRDIGLMGPMTPVALPSVVGKTALSFSGLTGKIVLEDIPVTVSAGIPIFDLIMKLVGAHIENNLLLLQNRLMLVSDDVFKSVVTRGTQITARNVLEDQTKKSTNLWYEETVPTDAVFYTIFIPSFPGDLTLNNLKTNIPEVLQIGGNETVGNGFVHMSRDLALAFNPAVPEVSRG